MELVPIILGTCGLLAVVSLTVVLAVLAISLCVDLVKDMWEDR